MGITLRCALLQVVLSARLGAAATARVEVAAGIKRIVGAGSRQGRRRMGTIAIARRAAGEGVGVANPGRADARVERQVGLDCRQRRQARRPLSEVPARRAVTWPGSPLGDIPWCRPRKVGFDSCPQFPGYQPGRDLSNNPPPAPSIRPGPPRESPKSNAFLSHLKNGLLPPSHGDPEGNRIISNLGSPF